MKKRLSIALQQDLKKDLLRVKTDSLDNGVNEGRVINPIYTKIDNCN